MLLGCVQVDGRGRVNSTVIGDFTRPRVRLPGGGGAAVLFQVVRRVIVFRTRHDLASLVSSVDFVTATGNLDRVVTPLAVFRATPAGLRLEALQPDATLEEVTRQTGFAVEPLGEIELLAPPTAAELAALEALDPDHLRDLDFQ
jgi:glutaconate CoA-transferase subunit B